MGEQIVRRLAYHDQTSQIQVVDQFELLALPLPMIILGDPGIGKTTLLETIGEKDGYRYIRAGTFVRSSVVSPPGEGEVFVIDGVDEIASNVPGGGVEAVLQKLSSFGNPPFILSCREADWRGASDRIKISDDYGSEPTLLHLQSFDRHDALLFLQQEFPGADAEGVLTGLAERGLEEIYENPLTLRLLGQVAEKHGALPATKVELFEQACQLLILEDNVRHAGADHAKADPADVLLAAGAACASLLLADRTGIYTGAYSQTPEDYIPIGSLDGLALAETLPLALKTRIFKAEGENRFSPIHRIIAEYLGGKWLAACAERGVSHRRLLSLFHFGDSVPTSLRGLYAWMAQFSSQLAEHCIDADPYGVLLHGDPGKLPLHLARRLLSAVRTLEQADPMFRVGQWGRSPARGLMRMELIDDIKAIIEVQQIDSQVRGLVLEALPDTEVGKALTDSLVAILLDPTKQIGTREKTIDTLHGSLTPTETTRLIKSLIQFGDNASWELAVDLIRDRPSAGLDMALVAEVFAGHLGLTRVDSQQRSEDRFFYDPFNGALNAFTPADTALLLDHLAQYKPFLKGAPYRTAYGWSEFIYKCVIEVLESKQPVDTQTLWTWISMIKSDNGVRAEKKDRLKQLLEGDLRSGLLRHVLFAAKMEAIRDFWRLREVCDGMYLNAAEVTQLIQEFHAQHRSHPHYESRLRELTTLGRSINGLAPDVKTAALAAAEGLPQTKRFVRKLDVDFEATQRRQESKRRARQELTYRETYAHYRREISSQLRAGNELSAGLLYDLANVYFGLWSELKSLTPEERISAVVGADRVDVVLASFRDVFSRSGAPVSADIVRSHIDGKEFFLERPMICGATELLKRDGTLNALSRDQQRTAHMAFRRMPSFDESSINAADAMLKSAVCSSSADREAFFRTSIEPQLAAKRTDTRDIYQLVHEPQNADIAGPLLLEWLDRFEDTSEVALLEIMDGALKHSDREVLASMAAARRSRPGVPLETERLWQTVDFLLNFDEGKLAIETLAREEDNLIWRVRNRIVRDHRGKPESLTLQQAAFIATTFSGIWPHKDRPGSTSGHENAWDASDFIEASIYSMSNDPSPAASEMLERLISSVDASYERIAKHALALQKRLRRDTEFSAPSIDQIKAVTANALPESIDDMRAYFGDRLAEMQSKLRSSETDRNDVYWREGRPQSENYCRNRLIDDIARELPTSIRFVPEQQMAGQNRADIAAVRNAIGLPVEIKGQWHPQVWDAVGNQLTAKYSPDWRAEGRGAYIVIWFGDVGSSNLPPHPNGLPAPQTPEELKRMLEDRVPDEHKANIDVYVIEIPKPKALPVKKPRKPRKPKAK